MDNRVDSIKQILENFLEELDERFDATDIEKILLGDLQITGENLGSAPETFTEDALIWEILDELGLERGSGRPVDSEGKEPDFKIDNFDEIGVIGENKPVNDSIEQAEKELISEYLSRMAWSNNGIATDGFEWRLYKAQKIGDTVKFPRLDEGEGDLRQVVQQLAREKGLIPSQQITEIDVDEKLEEFVSKFGKENLEELFGDEAPKEFRDERKKDIDEFFELYIELLFGEGSEHDYEINLLNEITAPEEATEEDKRMFAVTLMNRLLFVKFLESREILPEGFLRERVKDYQEIGDRLQGSLYETTFIPLFYDLLGDEERDEDGANWQNEVPYLNGGLFREKLEDEKEYTVSDRILPTIVNDLIEGSKLSNNGGTFDPGLLGSVFEKTINHLEADNTQKDIGAFYTPSDVTDLIVEQSVNPKLKEAIIESTVEEFNDEIENSIRDELEPKELQEILKMLESQESYFGKAAPAENILEEVQELNILDPACGSGHFLTSAMDQVHQVQLSALLNLNRGEEPSDEEKFKAKRKIALNSIYGVDVDEIASEIAMLRVWLKIVEENGWEKEFGKLPNIDVNITAGNSLIGFPIKGETQSTFDVANDQLERLEKLRNQYKNDQIDKEKLEELEEEVREILDKQYLKFQTNYVETEITNVESLKKIRESLDEDYVNQVFQKIKVEREDGEALEEGDKNFLDDRGFTWQEWRDTNKSASLEIQERWEKLGSEQNGDRHGQILDELKEILDKHFEFSEVIRRPVKSDLDGILGRPFHWGAEFPEILDQKDLKKGDSLNFDIVLGNPPYGDILGDEAKILIDSYQTSSFNDVAVQFKERQFQLLEEGGYFGNITTLRLIYQSNMEKLHSVIHSKLRGTKISCFASRPSKIFQNADVRVAIMTGEKHTLERNEIQTSEYILFDQDDRKERLENIQHSSTEGLYLKNTIGGEDDGYKVMPKVGGLKNRKILEKLKENSDRVMRDVYERNSDSENILWRPRGGRYWINPMLEELYESTGIKPMYFESETERNLGFLILNSSLYYFYWMTYGNQRNIDWSRLGAFPFPEDEKIESKEEKINELAEKIWEKMKSSFNPDTNEIHTNKAKPVVDEADELLGEFFGLSEDQVEFIKSYNTKYCRTDKDQKQENLS